MSAWYKQIFLWGQTNLTEDDPEKCDLGFWIDYWKKTGVEGIIINCGGIVSYYQSRFEMQYKAAMLGDKDYFGEWNKAAREAGLAVVARMDINATTKKMYLENPSWYCVDKEGNPILSQGRYVACVNGGYYQKFLPRVFEEIIEKYHPNGFADNSWAGLTRATICYCDNCRRKFREECGLDLPEKVDWENPTYRRWVRWNYELRVRNWNFYNEVTRSAGGEDCRWFGMLNADPFDTGGRFYDIRKLAEHSEFIFCDHQGREDHYGFEQNSVNGNLFRMIAGEDVTVAESMAHYYKGVRTFRLSAAPRQEVRNWMLSGVSGGIAPWYHFVGGQTADRRKFEISDDLYRWLGERKLYLSNRRNCASIGLVWNQESAVYYGRDKGKVYSGYPFYGFAKALSKAGIPFVPIHADDLDKYADRLEVLILPNVAILSREQEEKVICCLEAGKGLVMTCVTGLMDEDGEERVEEGLLWHYLGLKKTGGMIGAGDDTKADWMHHDAHNYMKVDGKCQLLEGLENTDILPFGGRVVRTESCGSLKQAMHLIPSFPIYPPEFAWIREEDEHFAMVYTGTLSSGARVVYMPADLDRCYMQYVLPDLGKLLENAVRYAADGRIPVQVEALGQVHLDAYMQEDRLILHLLNFCGCDGPIGSVVENLPVGPVKIRIQKDVADREAVSLITDRKFHICRDGNEFCISLDRLEEQEMLLMRIN